MPTSYARANASDHGTGRTPLSFLRARLDLSLDDPGEARQNTDPAGSAPLLAGPERRDETRVAAQSGSFGTPPRQLTERSQLS